MPDPHPTAPFLDPAATAGLRDALTAAGHTVDGAYALLGADAHAALSRNETVPARRATADGSPLSTLIRLFQLQLDVDRRDVDRALPGLVEPLVAGGLLATEGALVRALVDVRPYGDTEHDWWIVCDLTPGLDARPVTVGPDHVLGISEASSSLAQLTVRPEVGRALDLGTGCGVQALHLAQHAGHVVATDVNPRALAAARLTAALNDIAVDVRDGSLFDPVAQERFDLIATNPPFVVSPPDGDRLVYRETGFAGDKVVRRLVAGAADHLNPGGWCQVLASWIHPVGGDWADRLAEWIAPTGLDAWVVQRERLDLAAYTEMWLADAGHRGTPSYPRRYDAWLDWFAAQGVEAMGFGWISLRRAERDVPAVQIEHVDVAVAPPVATAVLDWARRVDARAGGLLDVHWRTPVDLVQDTHGAIGAEDPETIVARLQLGLQRTRRLDTIEAGLLSASDGELTPGQILDALAQLLGRDAAELRERYTPAVAELVQDGFLTV